MDVEFERAQEAHRAVFAMVTAALSNPEHADLESMIRDRIADTPSPGRALTDMVHVAVWHAAGALITHTEGDVGRALDLVRLGALTQELKQPKEEP